MTKGIAELSTNSIEAWRHFTKGVEYINQLLNTEATDQFEKAVAADSNFIAARLYLLQLEELGNY